MFYDPKSPELPAPLKEACISGDLSQAKSLYHSHVLAHPSETASTLSRMAILSAAHSHPTLLTFCFSSGFQMDSENINDPLVYAACDSASLPIFSILLSHGMPVDKYIELSGCPLVAACSSGNLPLARFLLDRGADPNNDFCSGPYVALVWAVVGGHDHHASVELVKLLLERGCKVEGTGALIAAADYGNLEGLRVLVEHAEATGDGGLEESVIYGEYDARTLDEQGTALYRGAASGHLAVVEFLLERGADAKFEDPRGRSVLDVAVERGHENVVFVIRLHESGDGGMG